MTACLWSQRGELAGGSSSGAEGQRASDGYLPSVSNSHLTLCQSSPHPHLMLSQATVGFIDQIFNASSGLLNSLLTLLNERKIEGSDAEVRLRTVIGTCGKRSGSINQTPIGVKLSLKMYDCRAGEPPDEPALAPLADRFLFAAELSPVSRSARLKLLDRKSDEDEPITQESIAALVSPSIR